LPHYQLYIDPDEPEDQKLVELFKKLRISGCVITWRIHPDYPELIRNSPILDLSGWEKIKKHLSGLPPKE